MDSENSDIWVDPNAEICRVIATDCFSSLASTAPDTERSTRHFALPGTALTIESTGTDTGQLLTAAFAHLETDGPAPEGKPLVWRIADAGAPGTFPEFPPPPSPMPEFGIFNVSPEGDLFIERRRGMVSVCDPKSRVITSICQGADALENDVIAKPLLRFLMGILHQQGIYLAHAALVGLNGRGLLVTGKGGMGKSTISSAALYGGLSFCADDFVAVQRIGDTIIGHSLYATLMFHRDQLERHPHFEGQCRAARSAVVPKSVVILGAKFKAQTVARLQIDAIAVPRISDAPRSHLQPMSRVAALRALAPTSVFASPWRRVDLAQFLIDLAADLSCYEYVSGSNFAGISEPVRERYA